MRTSSFTALALILWCVAATAHAQQGEERREGTIRGTVTYQTSGQPIPHVTVQIIQLRRTTETDDDGTYQFTNLRPGSYTVTTHLEGIPDAVRTTTVGGGSIVTLDFEVSIAGLREQVTVTASGTEESTAESFRSVNSVNFVTLTEESHPSIGEVLDKEPGVAKRSFGPGSSRPVIRGFDGDRVLILKDGIRTGSLGSQSGDHGEPIDVLQLERLEVVKGPATLLYGSNAIGGVVNAVTRDEQSRHIGLRGYLTALAGSANSQAGTSGGVEFGYRSWLFWGSGSGQRTGDYATPINRVPNSQTRVGNGEGGFGYFGDKGFFSTSYNYDDRRYGIPFAAEFEEHTEGRESAAKNGITVRPETVLRPPANAGAADADEQIDLAMRRHNFRVSGGFHNVDGFISGMRVNADYTNYQHRELEGETTGTIFDNRIFSHRTQFEQRRYQRLAGRFGFEGFTRDYQTNGAEALVRGAVDQHMFSLFGLEELNFERVKLQFGGRVETNRYRVSDPAEPDRVFTGFSGAAGILFKLFDGGALLANYTHSYRAPALEELYNNGPHIGNLTFEIGNSRLRRERGNGADFSFRHSSRRVSADLSLFYYAIRDFVFLAPIDADRNGEIDTSEGLPVAEYFQEDARFVGADLGLNIDFTHYLGMNLRVDMVDAQLKKSGVPLPRIPPLRASVGVDARYGGFSFRPEVTMVKDQDEIFLTETRTPGYALFNIVSSYTIARPHYAHIISVNAFNLGDTLYRNHLSFIKELAPEIGRGLRVTYTVRYF